MNAVALAEGLASESSASLEQELRSLNAHMSAGTYRFLMLVRVFDKRVTLG